MSPVVGTLVIKTTLSHKRPGVQNKNTLWHKQVTLHTEHHVDLETAQQILQEWKTANNGMDVVAVFSAALY